MKQLIKLIPFALIALLAFAGCQGPFSLPSDGGAGSLVVNVTNGCMGGARTLYPNDPTASFDQIELTLADGPGQDQSYTLTSGSQHTFDELIPGTYTLTAEGKINLGSPPVMTTVASGTMTVTIHDQAAAHHEYIELTATMTGVNGYLAYTYTGPGNVTSASLTVSQYAGSGFSQVGPVVNNIDTGTPSPISLNPGYYLVTVKAYDDIGQLAVQNEVVHIYSGLTTTWNIEFTGDSFAEYLTLSGLVNFTADGETPDYYIITVTMSTYSGWTTIASEEFFSGSWSINLPVFRNTSNLRISAAAYRNPDIKLAGEPNPQDYNGVNSESKADIDFTGAIENITYTAYLAKDSEDVLTVVNLASRFRPFTSPAGTQLYQYTYFRVNYAFRSDENLHQLAFTLAGVGASATGGYEQLANYRGVTVNGTPWGNIPSGELISGSVDLYLDLAGFPYEPANIILDISAGSEYTNPNTATVTFYELSVIRLERFVHFYPNNVNADNPGSYWEIYTSQGGTINPPTPTLQSSWAEGWGAGVTLTGWNTEADGTGNWFTAATPVTTNMSVHAQWAYTPGVTTGTGSDTMEVIAPQMTTNSGDGSGQGSWSGTFDAATGIADYSGGAIRYMFPSEALNYDFVTLEYIHEGNLQVILKQGTTGTNFNSKDGTLYPTLVNGAGYFDFVIYGMSAGNNYGIAFQQNNYGDPANTSGRVKWTKATFTKGTHYTVTFDAAGGSVSPGTKDVLDGVPLGTLPTPTKGEDTFTGWTLNSTIVDATTTVDYSFYNATLVATWKTPVPAAPIVVNFTDAGLAVPSALNLVASADIAPDGSSYTLNYLGGYGQVYAVFELTFDQPPDLSDYKSVTFTYKGEAGDINSKQVRLLAAGSTGSPNVGLYNQLSDDEAGQSDGGFMIAGRQNVTGTTASTFTLDLNGRKNVLASETTVRFAFYIHAASNSAATKYTISNVTFNPMVSSVPVTPGPPLVVSGVPIDFSDPQVALTQVGTVNNYAETASSYSFDGAYPNYVKFTVDLGTDKLSDYGIITFGVSGQTTYKALDVIGAKVVSGIGLSATGGSVPSTSESVTGIARYNYPFANSDLTNETATYIIADNAYTQSLTGVIELAVVADNAIGSGTNAYTIANFRLIKTLKVNFSNVSELTSVGVTDASVYEGGIMYTQNQANGASYIKFSVDFGIGKSIADYDRVVFRVNSSSSTYKAIQLAAAATIPNGTVLNDSSTYLVNTKDNWTENPSWNYSTGGKELVLYLDPAKKAVLSGSQTLEIAIVPTDGQATDPWVFQNIRFVPADN